MAYQYRIRSVTGVLYGPVNAQDVWDAVSFYPESVGRIERKSARGWEDLTLAFACEIYAAEYYNKIVQGEPDRTARIFIIQDRVGPERRAVLEREVEDEITADAAA